MKLAVEASAGALMSRVAGGDRKAARERRLIPSSLVPIGSPTVRLDRLRPVAE